MKEFEIACIMILNFVKQLEKLKINNSRPIYDFDFESHQLE